MHTTHKETWGLWLGLLGVIVFAVTLPMTRLATGTTDTPYLTPWFVTVGRAALAGVLSLLVLGLGQASWPPAQQRKALGLSLLCTVIGFPLLLGLALRSVSSSHAAVFTALLPLATAVAAAVLLGQRARLGFWLFAVAGASLVIAFALVRAAQQGHAWQLEPADGLLLLAILCAAVGYVYGSKATAAMGAERVICWICALALPLTLPLTWLSWPSESVPWSAWGGLVYVGVFSMWLGFFAWYRGLAWGGVMRVSQVQLLQPFVSIVAGMIILGEPFEISTLLFAAGVVATVFAGKRFAPKAAA